MKNRSDGPVNTGRWCPVYGLDGHGVGNFIDNPLAGAGWIHQSYVRSGMWATR
jgi:hypothetical protein